MSELSDSKDNQAISESHWKKRFDIFASIIGFIVDSKELISMITSSIMSSIALVSLIWSTKNTAQIPTFLFTNITIPPIYLFAIWFLSLYSFYGFLRSLWSKKKEHNEFDNRFLGFVLNDLILNFRIPILSIFTVAFGFIWSILGYNIIFELGGSEITWVFIVVLIIYAIYKSFALREKQKAEVIAKSVEDNWEKWDDAINKLFIKNWHVKRDDLESLAHYFALPVHNAMYSDVFDIVLSKYEELHREEAIYRYVYTKDRRIPLLYDKNSSGNFYALPVLISLRKFPTDKYYFSTERKHSEYASYWR